MTNLPKIVYTLKGKRFSPEGEMDREPAFLNFQPKAVNANEERDVSSPPISQDHDQ